MEQRRLGGQGLTVSALGLGCMGMTWAYSGGGDAAEKRRCSRRSTPVSRCSTRPRSTGPLPTKRWSGAAIKGSAGTGVVLATKFGFRISPDGQDAGLDSRPDHIREVGMPRSPGWAGTDRIDLLYQHRVDPSVPIEDVVGAMAELVRAGKIRYLGLEANAATVRRAHTIHPISVLQSEYSLWERGIEAEILPTCRTLGIGWSPTHRSAAGS